MGVDYDSILVFGWEVNYEDIVRFLIQNRVGTCLGEYEEDAETKEIHVADGTKRGNKYQCFCGTKHCWEKTECFPPGVTIEKASPYFDCGAEEANYVVSLTLPYPCTLASMNAIPKETIDAARAFVKQLSGKEVKKARQSEEEIIEEEPTFMSLVNTT